MTIDPGSRNNFQQLLTRVPQVPLSDPSLPDGHTNFYRSDDVAAVAYFYLDRPENGLAPRRAGRRKASRAAPASAGAARSASQLTPRRLMPASARGRRGR